MFACRRLRDGVDAGGCIAVVACRRLRQGSGRG